MMKILSASLLALAFAGCSSSPDAITLKSTKVDAFFDWAPDSLTVWIQKPGASWPNAGKDGDCVSLSSATTISTTDDQGTTTQGYAIQLGEEAAENQCQAPALEVDLDVQPATLDVVVDDGTGKLELSLTMTVDPDDGTVDTEVVSCDAPAGCVNALPY